MPTDVHLACHGILFDCDGVLVDSDASVARAWRRWADAYGLRPEAVAEMVHGRRSADTVGLLIAAERRDEALGAIDQLELEDAGTVLAIPGAAELSHRLPSSIWAVVTSGASPLPEARLRAAGVVVPDVLVSAADVENGKPAPDGFLAAARALGLAAAVVIVLEDSSAGVEAARAAGVSAVVGVGRRALATDADVVVADLRELHWTGGGLRIGGRSILRSPDAAQDAAREGSD
jgi:sugar-phosphatase